MNWLFLKEGATFPSNMFHGIIVEAENFINLHPKMQLISNDWKLMAPNLILSISPTLFVWYSEITGKNFDAISCIIDKQYETKGHQMLLYKTNEPIRVSPDLNWDETDPDEIVVHVFRTDDDDKSFFEEKCSLNTFSRSNNMTEDEFSIVKPDGSFSPRYHSHAIVDLIKAEQKKFATVVVKKKSLLVKDKMRLITAIRDLKYLRSNLYCANIPICQGSSSEITKLACSLDSELPCAYVNFRKKDELANPEKSSLGDLFLNCPLPLDENSFNCMSLSVTNIGTYVHLIFAIASDYHDRVLILKSDLNVSGKISSEESKGIRRQIMQECLEGKFFGPELEKFKQMKPLEILSTSFSLTSYEVWKISKKIREELDLPSESSPLIIALDEVSLLNFDIKKSFADSLKDPSATSTDYYSILTRLRLLRRAMHALESSNIVFLTLGTQPDYTDPNPGVITPSSRDVKRSGACSPFILSRFD
jgi:hypothetical protein